MTKPTSTPEAHALAIRDVVEIVVGGCVLAFPVAVTEEVWNLSESLSGARIALISLSSVLFLAAFAYHSYPGASGRDLLARTFASYLVTIALAAAILFAVDRLPLLEQPLVAVKRALLVAFPACFSATVVDSFS